ncbi:hypothetical protein IWW37_000741 [Coemansia sp. RSA 2050]|nr:hypothetical protein IWW37_000741 [Coemansia sp. RSA 2050]KAJ2735895.1 hypothetical protein IW152_001193 [Coemansia sp. BCRC 34962]
MALTDITQQANNSGGARTPTRQTTLFDALNAAQRHSNKRQRRSAPFSSTGQENIAPESNSDQAEGKLLKRVRIESLNIAVPVLPTHSSAANKCILPTLAPAPAPAPAPKSPAAQFGSLYSARAAIRLRQRQLNVSMRAISTLSRLESLLSPEARVYRLQAEEDSPTGTLPLACKYGNSVGLRSRLALVDEGGMISLFDPVNGGVGAAGEAGMQPVVRWRGHDNSVFDVEWCADDMRMVTASADETCRLWDVEQQKLLGVFSGHSQTVRSVSWRHEDQNCFSSASRDGSIMMWDLRVNKTKVGDEYSYRPVNAISRAHYGLRHAGTMSRGKGSLVAGSVTAIKSLRHNANLVASVGSTSEIVRYWDVRMSAPTRATELPTPAAASLLPVSGGRSRGTSSLTLDPDGTRLYSACNNNRVYVHNALLPGAPIAQLDAPEFECSSFNITTSMSPCGRHLAAGSTNGSVVVWELDMYGQGSSGQRAVLQGHVKEAGCVAWYPGAERTQLATCGDDGTMRVWDINAELADVAKADPMKRCSWGFTSIHRTP